MSWYHYRQNNTGGSFTVDERVGHHVLVEAATPAEADARAREIGLYFDGCDTADDCPCCGDRWSSAEVATASDEPKIYGEDLDTWRPFSLWNGQVVAVVYPLVGEPTRRVYTERSTVAW